MIYNINENIIWFLFNNHLLIDDHSYYDNLSILQINLDNVNQHTNLISLSINTFNSEIKWDNMWSLDDSLLRFNNNHHLYLLLLNENPIGHVWYNKGFLYNAFVSNKRPTGSSSWFIKQTMIDRFKYGYNTIMLYTETWNVKAIHFWNKLGFIKCD